MCSCLCVLHHVYNSLTFFSQVDTNAVDGIQICYCSDDVASNLYRLKVRLKILFELQSVGDLAVVSYQPQPFWDTIASASNAYQCVRIKNSKKKQKQKTEVSATNT